MTIQTRTWHPAASIGLAPRKEVPANSPFWALRELPRDEALQVVYDFLGSMPIDREHRDLIRETLDFIGWDIDDPDALDRVECVEEAAMDLRRAVEQRHP